MYTLTCAVSCCTFMICGINTFLICSFLCSVPKLNANSVMACRLEGALLYMIVANTTVEDNGEKAEFSSYFPLIFFSWKQNCLNDLNY